MSSPSRQVYGGQALVEGVLIRTTDRYAVAMRRPDGLIHAHAGRIAEARSYWRWPLLRGLRALGVQLHVGMRALMQSSLLADTGEVRPLPAGLMVYVTAVATAIGLLVFALLPLALTGREPFGEASLWERLSEGGIKIALLAAYVVGVTRLARYRRIFSYHGAEHMAIACAEAGQELTVENVARFSPAHPRCGTGFLVILATVDTVVLAVLPRLGPVPDLALRVAFLPITAAVAYELLRWGSRQRGIGSALNRFGMLTQRLTTARPDRDQIEVAIAAMELCRAPRAAGLDPARGAGPALTPETA
ncbi:MAG TPA: DUF1385 domain-containing protein [candidate division Zixibacteria bacterium]|nr:DUF1385 domain-containing protein [candidate division Zixibacteria bacterium]